MLPVTTAMCVFYTFPFEWSISCEVHVGMQMEASKTPNGSHDTSLMVNKQLHRTFYYIHLVRAHWDGWYRWHSVPDQLYRTANCTNWDCTPAGNPLPSIDLNSCRWANGHSKLSTHRMLSGRGDLLSISRMTTITLNKYANICTDAYRKFVFGHWILIGMCGGMCVWLSARTKMSDFISRYTFIQFSDRVLIFGHT